MQRSKMMKTVPAILAVLSVMAAVAKCQEHQLAAIQSVEIGEHRELRINGKPFFPIMSWAQGTQRFPLLKSLGFNTFCGSSGGKREVLEAARGVGAYAIVGAERFDPTHAGHPALLAYNLRDEPDLGIDSDRGPRVPAEEVKGWYNAAKQSDPARPVFLNFTASFMNQFGGRSDDVKAYYEAASKAADILCFDIYPIYQRNRDDKLTWVADGVTDLIQFAGRDKPVWAWIETSKGSKWITYERQKDVTPEIVRSEVWMAVIRGATGIGYFTHAWRPEFTEFAPKENVRVELSRTNRQLQQLAPVILSGPAPLQAGIVFGDALHGEVTTREFEGGLYIFANNLDMKDLGDRRDDVLTTYRGGRARISVPGLQAGTRIEVIDEGRTITAENGAFVDDFRPLEVHIYRMKFVSAPASG